MPPAPLTHGVILSALHSGSGKTATTCAILAALAQRQLNPHPFKVGPDFIDPQYHRIAAGTASHNLDLHLMGLDGISQTLLRHAASGIAVVEGVMGLFDGMSPHTDEGSTAHLAALTGWPVILVLDASGGGRTLARTVQSLKETEVPHLAGVIVTKSAGPSHTDYLRAAFTSCGIQLLGALPKSPLLDWQSRYLGLTAPSERPPASPDALAAFATDHLDLESILAACRVGRINPPASDLSQPITAFTAPRTVAVASDDAFHFLYPAWNEWLVNHGFTVLPFSPLRDAQPPSNADALFLPGGFPERFAQQLAANESMRSAIQTLIQNEMPTYAECGGLMYLTEAILTEDGRRFPMCGVLPGTSAMSPRLKHFGYCHAGDQQIPGHEFHRSEWTPSTAFSAHAWQVTHRRSGASRKEGAQIANLHASYVHLHPATAGPFVHRILTR
jgi:cobyrinic acid a,c-diamide synthase